GLSAVRPHAPEAVKPRNWLIAGAGWQLWLARPIVSDVRLPWEHARPDGLFTPGHVQRHFPGILVRVGTPARAPRGRGKWPGRPGGYRPKPPLPYRVARRAPPHAA